MNFYIYLPILVSIVIACFLIKDINKKLDTYTIIEIVSLFMIIPVLIITVLCVMSEKFPDWYTPITILIWVLLALQFISSIILDVVTSFIESI